MKTRFVIPALALMPIFVLAGCGDDPAPATDDAPREASGEVLEGSISDDMLPIDQLRSQAPLAAGEASDDEAESGDE